MSTVYSKEEYQEALKREDIEIIIADPKLAKNTAILLEFNKLSWIAIMAVLPLSMGVICASGGVLAPAALAVCSGLIPIIGTSGVIAMVAVAYALGCVGLLSVLRKKYSIVEKNEIILRLRRK
jgi:uncharacterized membrane protein